MGGAMAARLQKSGHELYVHTRTRAKAEPLLQAGAFWAASPAAAVRHAEACFTMLGFPEDVEQTYLGESGVMSALHPDFRFAVDMTSTRPALARSLALAFARQDVGFLDAPVSGGEPGARNGSLSIMVGGDESAFAQALPVLRELGQTIEYAGAAGAGQQTKLANQILVAGNMIGACEALLFASRAGLDMQKTLNLIGAGAGASWSINQLGPRILRRDFAPGFFVEHFVKDMGIALEEADRMNLALPGLALVRQLYIALKAQGEGRSGTQALMLALERLNAGPTAPDRPAAPG